MILLFMKKQAKLVGSGVIMSILERLAMCRRICIHFPLKQIQIGAEPLAHRAKFTAICDAVQKSTIYATK